MAKYEGESRLIVKELKVRFKPDDVVFVCDMLDIFSPDVTDESIATVLECIAKWPKVQFLLLTKNPKRYIRFIYSDIEIRKNVIFGATIESDRDYPDLSKAPSQTDRLYRMETLHRYVDCDKWRRFISVEPILDFNLEPFLLALMRINPWAVAVGYDNYDNHLPEPPLEKTMQLIERLEKAGITVYRKTLREAWNERQ